MKTAFRTLALSLLALVALAARAADDLKAMSGTWKPAQAELGGQPLPAEILKTAVLKMDGGNYHVTVETDKGTVTDKGTIALDAAAKPKAMTITGVDGPNAGKTFPAIYEFKGAALRVCYDLSGASRPTEFKSPPGTRLYLVTYERTN